MAEFNNTEPYEVRKQKALEEIDAEIASIQEKFNALNEKDNTSPEHCKKCKGRCCKFPCGFIPSQVMEMLGVDTLTKDNLRKFLETGKYSLDYWNDFDYTDYFFNDWFLIRYRSRNSPISDEDCNWNGCINLTEDGCSLPFHQRGADGQALVCKTVVKEGFICDSTIGKRELGLSWFHYHDILRELWNEFITREENGELFNDN